MSTFNDEDDDLQQDTPDTSDDQDTDATPAAASPAPLNPAVAAYLQNKQDLAAAQKKASTDQLLAGLARAGGTLAHSTYGNTTPMNEAPYDAMDAAANSPVQNVLTAQKSAAQEVGTQSAIQAAGKQTERDDPSSVPSQVFQQLVKKTWPGKFTDEQLSNIAASDADLISKPLELDEKIKERQQEHSDTQSTKATDNQAKAYTSMRKDLETFRGNQSAQQAAVAVQNADKALALTNSTPTPQNLALLADEMGKIAMNGVPSESGQKALLPNNLYTKAAEWKAWATGHPNASAADVTEYLNNNRDYINQVRKISADTLHSYRTNISKGYRGRVSDDQFAEATADYGLGGAPAPAAASSPAIAAPVPRKTADGRIGLFDPKTKAFLRYQ